MGSIGVKLKQSLASEGAMHERHPERLAMKSYADERLGAVTRGSRFNLVMASPSNAVDEAYC